MGLFTLIAGPCVIESEENVMLIAEKMKSIVDKLGLDYYFKASFDKANRTSFDSYRGPGIEEGLRILSKVKKTYHLRICTDIHETWQAEKVAEVADIIQIPAFLCRQTDLLLAAARTGKIVNVKKAQFLAPWDMENVIKKLEEAGNYNIMICERGSTFGYNTLIVDMTSIPEMKKFGYPVVFDATHSVQKPGGKGTATGGNREYIEPLAKAAIAAGADSLFFEVHPEPDKALSDGPNMVKLDEFEEMLERIIRVYENSKLAKRTKLKTNTDEVDAIEKGYRVFDIEINALQKMRDSLDETFSNILECITVCKGKVIITGMGKPGHIASKIASTMSSLGTSAFYLDPAEAMHGDLGMISADDIVIAISYSGESDEIVHILPNIKLIGAKIIGITGNPLSTLAKASDLVQALPDFKEACYMGLAPTSSTTVELVYGDALAVAASSVYGFRDVDFGRLHPAGSLGKRLILKVRDLMVDFDQCSKVEENMKLVEAISQMSKSVPGMVTVIDGDRHVIGIITDGDLRRLLSKHVDIYSINVGDSMTRSPKVISSDVMAVNALNYMKENNITSMPVVDDGKFVGIVSMPAILKAGIFATI